MKDLRADGFKPGGVRFSDAESGKKFVPGQRGVVSAEDLVQAALGALFGIREVCGFGDFFGGEARDDSGGYVAIALGLGDGGEDFLGVDHGGMTEDEIWMTNEQSGRGKNARALSGYVWLFGGGFGFLGMRARSPASGWVRFGWGLAE